MKKLLSCLLILLLALLCLAACGFGGTDGLTFYKKDDGTYAVGGGTTNLLTSITIPSMHKGRKVTEIIDRGFYNFSNLQNVILPKSIKTIGNLAFAECEKLESVVLSPDNMYVESGAFKKCSQDLCFYSKGEVSEWSVTFEDESFRPWIRYYTDSGTCEPFLYQWTYDTALRIVPVDCRDEDGDLLCDKCAGVLSCTDTWVYPLPRQILADRFDDLILRPCVRQIQKVWAANLGTLSPVYKNVLYNYQANANAKNEDGTYNLSTVNQYVAAILPKLMLVDENAYNNACDTLNILGDYSMDKKTGNYVLNPDLSNDLLADAAETFAVLVSGYTCLQRRADEIASGLRVCPHCIALVNKKCEDLDRDGFCDMCGVGGGGTTCTRHMDANHDQKCDNTGCMADVLCTHKFGEDGICEWCDDIKCTVHVDKRPRDLKCDICGDDLPCMDHDDADANRKCDFCQITWSCPLSEHKDENRDGCCDECAYILSR